MNGLKEYITIINILHDSFKLQLYFCLKLMNKIYLMRKAIPFKCHKVVFLDTQKFYCPI